MRIVVADTVRSTFAVAEAAQCDQPPNNQFHRPVNGGAALAVADP